MLNEEQSVYTDDYDDGFNKFFEDIKKNPQYDSEVIKKAMTLHVMLTKISVGVRVSLILCIL